jgi:hypothetical protein
MRPFPTAIAVAVTSESVESGTVLVTAVPRVGGRVGGDRANQSKE